MTRVILPAAVVAAGLLFSVSAFAHAHFVSSTPAAGGAVPTAPATVAINYTEGVEPAFSTIEVQDAAGARVDTGKAHTAPDDNKRLIIGLKPLHAGRYTVTWHATAVDTHKTQGSFTFTVGN